MKTIAVFFIITLYASFGYSQSGKMNFSKHYDSWHSSMQKASERDLRASENATLDYLLTETRQLLFLPETRYEPDSHSNVTNDATEMLNVLHRETQALPVIHPPISVSCLAIIKLHRLNSHDQPAKCTTVRSHCKPATT